MTTAPRTLLSLSGATPALPSLAESTLLLIDMQQEYLDGLLPLPGAAAAVAEAGRLVSVARNAGAAVIHVVHRGRAGGAFDPSGRGFAPAAGVAPAGTEPVIEKALPNAFAGTDLSLRLAERRGRPLVVCGFMTHMCVSSTVRAAVDQGLLPTVVASATASRALPDPLGGIIDAETVHRAALAALADRFALVVRDVPSLLTAETARVA